MNLKVNLLREGIKRVRNSAFSPQQAEELWRQDGREMPWAERVRTPGRVWSLREAVAWIATRDLNKTADVCARMAFWAEMAGEVLHHEPCRDGHAVSLWEATCLLQEALMDGHLLASGIAHDELTTRMIPKSAWCGLSIGLGDGFHTSSAVAPGWRYQVPPSWFEVKLSGSDVQELWPLTSASPHRVNLAEKVLALATQVEKESYSNLAAGNSEQPRFKVGRRNQQGFRLTALSSVLRVRPAALELSDDKLSALIVAQLKKMPEAKGVSCGPTTVGRLKIICKPVLDWA